MMNRPAVSVFLLAFAGCLRAQIAASEPFDFNHVYAVEQGGSKLLALPSEPVRVAGKGAKRLASIQGSRAALRFREGELPILVIRFAVGSFQQGSARLYQMQPEPERRTAKLGLWAYSSAQRQSPGAVPVRLERYGKVSYRIVPPSVLRPGEYAISTAQGADAFTFGIDPK